jgi:nucleoside-diphosphate-sugar epimerase
VAGSVRDKKDLKVLAQKGLEGFLLDLDPMALLPETLAAETQILIFTIPPVRREIPDFYAQCIQTLIAQCKQLEQLIFTSSSGIYPQRSGDYFEDFSFLEGEKKANVLFLVEKAVLESKIPLITVLRPAGLFGPGRHPVLSLAGKQNLPHPSGHVNLVHQQDVIRAICLILERGEEATGIFNLAHPDHPWRKSYYTKLYRQYDLEALGFETSSTIDRMISGRKISDTLGFRYEFPLDRLEDVLANSL